MLKAKKSMLWYVMSSYLCKMEFCVTSLITVKFKHPWAFR